VKRPKNGCEGVRWPGPFLDTAPLRDLRDELGRLQPDAVDQRGGLTPTWSPNGEQLVFARPTATSTNQLFAMNTDGTGLTQITDIPGMNLPRTGRAQSPPLTHSPAPAVEPGHAAVPEHLDRQEGHRPLYPGGPAPSLPTRRGRDGRCQRNRRRSKARPTSVRLAAVAVLPLWETTEKVRRLGGLFRPA
jgi:hypothetical protein